MKYLGYLFFAFTVVFYVVGMVKVSFFRNLIPFLKPVGIRLLMFFYKVRKIKSQRY